MKITANTTPQQIIDHVGSQSKHEGRTLYLSGGRGQIKADVNHSRITSQNTFNSQQDAARDAVKNWVSGQMKGIGEDASSSILKKLEDAKPLTGYTLREIARHVKHAQAKKEYRDSVYDRLPGGKASYPILAEIDDRTEPINESFKNGIESKVNELRSQHAGRAKRTGRSDSVDGKVFKSISKEKPERRQAQLKGSRDYDQSQATTRLGKTCRKLGELLKRSRKENILPKQVHDDLKDRLKSIKESVEILKNSNLPADLAKQITSETIKQASHLRLDQRQLKLLYLEAQDYVPSEKLRNKVAAGDTLKKLKIEYGQDRG